ncbi:MAG: class I SAM-dependent RNA methyltransferase, partial [Pseudomonadota bacterium]
GTFPIEAAEIAQGLAPGRDRIFAYQSFANAPDPGGATGRGPFVAPTAEQTPETVRAFGRDRDAGAIRGATENAKRAGVLCDFQQGPLSDLAPPSQTPGLVMVNPPYGARIGNRKLLFGLYGSLGQALTERFQGWRVGLVTSDAGLAKATNLPFLDPDPPIAHGGLKVTLWRTGDL